jgi:molybdopterin molybdotransferase
VQGRGHRDLFRRQSVGDRDLIVDPVARRGEMIFHGIAVKPCKPTAFAIVDGAPFFGMPGNPTSCLSNAYILLVLFLRATARLPLYAPRTVSRRLAGALSRRRDGTSSIRCVRRTAPHFPPSRARRHHQPSQADGYIEIPSDQSVVEEGTTVTVTLF